MPFAFARAYEALGPGWRVILSIAVTAPLVNYLFSGVYAIASPATTGAATLVVVLSVNAALLGAAVPPRALLAVVARVCSDVWLASEMR